MIIVFLVFNKTNIIRLARAFLGVIISRKGQATVLFLIHPVPTQTFSARGLSRALYLAILINFKILNLGIDLSPANLEPIEPTTPIIPHLQDPFQSSSAAILESYNDVSTLFRREAISAL